MEIAEERRRMRRRRGKEVAPALLLLLVLLVACELPLHAAAAAVASDVWLPDVGSDPCSVFGYRERVICWYTRGEHTWFCRMWRLGLDIFWQRVDSAETYVVMVADPHPHFDDSRHFRGFAHFLLDLVRYPGKWRRPANDDGPLGRCFTLSFPPCLKKHGQVAADGAVLFCVLHFLYKCNYDKAVHVPDTNSFPDYTTPPGRHLPLPLTGGTVPVCDPQHQAPPPPPRTILQPLIR